MNRSSTRFILCTLVAVLACFQSQPAAVAGPIYQPVSASTNMGTWLGNINNTRNQSGITPAYTSGVTDFLNYVGTSGITGFTVNNRWTSNLNTFTGNVNYDLGAIYPIDSLAFWNWGGGDPVGINTFSLYADDNSSFTSPTLLGNYSAGSGYGVQVFSFAPQNQQYFRMSIATNHGSTVFSGFDEVAFGYSLVPEPGTYVVAGIGLLGLLLAKRRK
jgi:hypothetical protein